MHISPNYWVLCHLEVWSMDFPIINALSYKSTRGKSPCTDTSTREKPLLKKWWFVPIIPILEIKRIFILFLALLEREHVLRKWKSILKLCHKLIFFLCSSGNKCYKAAIVSIHFFSKSGLWNTYEDSEIKRKNRFLTESINFRPKCLNRYKKNKVSQSN